MYDGPAPQAKVYYTYRQPRSKILLSECTSAWARDQVRRGAFPKGSIWVPGSTTGQDARPDLGDLFAPDPLWKPPVPLNVVSDDHLPFQTHRRSA